MEYKRLGDYVRIRTGKLDANASSEYGQYPFFTCSVEPLKIDTYSYDCECALVAGNGDLNVKYYNGKFNAYQRTYIIESSNKSVLSVPYIYCFLDKYVETLRKQSVGGVIKYIKLGNLTEAKIPLCDIEKQYIIVKKLEKVKSIIKKRKQQLQQLDELVKSRFVEMFGDPALNQYNWDVVPIKDIVTDVRYGTSRPATDGGKYPYLRMNNLTYDGHLDLSDLKYIDIPENEIEKSIVRKGDVLFNRTNSIELVGKTCVFDLEEDMVIAGYIIRVRLNSKVLPVVLSSYMNSTVLKDKLRNMAKGAVNQANINAQELQSIKVYLPPLNLQNQFKTFVKQIDKSKVVVQKALDEAHTLFDSLMQEYFG